MKAAFARQRAVRIMRGMEDAEILYRLRAVEFDAAVNFIASYLKEWDEKATLRRKRKSKAGV